MARATEGGEFRLEPPLGAHDELALINYARDGCIKSRCPRRRRWAARSMNGIGGGGGVCWFIARLPCAGALCGTISAPR